MCYSCKIAKTSQQNVFVFKTLHITFNSSLPIMYLGGQSIMLVSTSKIMSVSMSVSNGHKLNIVLMPKLLELGGSIFHIF